MASSSASWAPERGGVHRLVLADAGGQGAHPQGIERVGGVLGVAAEADAGARPGQAGVTAVGADPLPQAQVGPRRVRDGGVGAEDDVALGVVEMHGVREQDMGSERAQRVEVHERAPVRTLQPCGRVARVGRDVKREDDALLAGERGRAGEQRIAHEAVADQRDRSSHQSIAGERIDHRALTIEDLVGGSRVRTGLDIPSPRADRAPHADGPHGGGDAHGMGDRARFDDRRHAVRHLLETGENRGQLVVVGGMGGMDGHRPAEDRLTRAQIIGDRAAYEPVAGEVLVGVHEPRCDDRGGVAEHFRFGPAGAGRAPSRPR